MFSRCSVDRPSLDFAALLINHITRMEKIHPAYTRNKNAKLEVNQSSEEYRMINPANPMANGFRKYNG